jgi:uncharacterized protein (TIGR03435 family)
MDAQLLRGLSGDQRKAMLQHLLEQQFHLQTHVETRTLPLLELSVAKEGIKFTEWQKPPDEQDQKKGSLNVNNEEMTAIGVPMESLVRFRSSMTPMPVVDKTGLKGAYNLHLKWQREEEGQSSGRSRPGSSDDLCSAARAVGIEAKIRQGPCEGACRRSNRTT